MISCCYLYTVGGFVVIDSIRLMFISKNLLLYKLFRLSMPTKEVSKEKSVKYTGTIAFFSILLAEDGETIYIKKYVKGV